MISLSELEANWHRQEQLRLSERALAALQRASELHAIRGIPLDAESREGLVRDASWRLMVASHG